MTCNVGNLDRLIRLVLGAGLFLSPYLTSFTVWDMGLARIVVMVVGALLVFSSALRFCPLYRLFGTNTCPA